MGAMQDGIIDEKKLAAVQGKLHAVDAVGKCAVIDPKQSDTGRLHVGIGEMTIEPWDSLSFTAFYQYSIISRGVPVIWEEFDKNGDD